MKERGFMPLFFFFIFAKVNRLLLIRDQSNNRYYVPVKTLQEVRRINSTTVRLYTTILTFDDGTNPEVATYDLVEAVGLGATDATQPQAIIDAWARALTSVTAIIPVPLPSALTSFQPTTATWK